MLHVCSDASYNPPILSCGYVIARGATPRQLVDTGTRVFNVESTEDTIEWCANRAEYRALIFAVREALPYTDEHITCRLDSDTVVTVIEQRRDTFDSWFEDMLFRYLDRFHEYTFEVVPREHNELAHEQARMGLKMGQQVMEAYEDA